MSEITINLLLANAAVAFASLVQASVGIGFGMIAIPILVLININYAPGPALFVMLFLSLFMVAKDWQHIDKQGLMPLFIGLFISTFFASFLLDWLNPQTFGLIFGGLIIFAIVITQFGFAVKSSFMVLITGGVIAGFMGTISGMHGPPLAVIYQGVANNKARVTIALIFVVASIFSLVFLNLQGHFGKLELFSALKLIPGLIIGILLAKISHGFISDNMARLLMLIVAAISAIILIFKSVTT